ncbi:MAG: signal peptidase I [Candidatus Aenigmatarchaeota archaeon]
MAEHNIKKVKKIWQSLTEGWFGYIFYAALGIIFAYLLQNVILSTLLGTHLPVVAVVSGSMDHGNYRGSLPCGGKVENYEENFDNWWELCKGFYENIGITKQQFLTFPFKNGFKRGDMPIVQGSNEYKVGDIIVYSVPTERAPIIHRIVKINPDGTYQTKGDHNLAQNPYEYSVRKDQIHGRVIFIIPKLGYFKVILSEIFGI